MLTDATFYVTIYLTRLVNNFEFENKEKREGAGAKDVLISLGKTKQERFCFPELENTEDERSNLRYMRRM